MKKLFFLFAFIPTTAFANPGPIVFSDYITGVSAQDLTATRSTSIMKTGGYNTLMLYVDLTWAAASDVTITCSSGPEVGVLGQHNSAAVTSGSGTLNGLSFTKAVTASEVVRVQFGVFDEFTQCSVSATGGTAGDLITVYARGGAL